MSIPPKRAFCDTSFFYASLDPKDENHDQAEQILRYCREHSIALYTTRDVVVETVTLLRYRLSYRGAMEFLNNIKPQLNILYPNEDLDSKVAQLFEKLSRDKKLSFCDIMSYVVVAEILGYIPCISFDSDFKTLGLSLLVI